MSPDAAIPGMQCSCMQPSAGAFQTGRAAHVHTRYSCRQTTSTKLVFRYSRSSVQTQQPAPCSSKQTRLNRHSQHICKAQQQEEEETAKEKDIVGGFDVNAPDGFLESEAVGVAVRVGFFLLISGGIAAILLLAKPVIDNTIQSFPYRSPGVTDQAGSSEPSLIPGLDDKAPEGESIF